MAGFATWAPRIVAVYYNQRADYDRNATVDIPLDRSKLYPPPPSFVTAAPHKLSGAIHTIEYAFESRSQVDSCRKNTWEVTRHRFRLLPKLLPFGCGVILGGYDIDGPQLYMIKPSGVSYKYYGVATGKGRQAAKIYVDQLWIS